MDGQATYPNNAQGLDQHSANQSSYWNIRTVRAREAEYAQKPLGAVCAKCCGLGVVKDPTPAHNEHGDYPYGTMIPCPVCTADKQRQWLQRNCGLEGELLDATLANWQQTRFEEIEFNKQRAVARIAMQNAIQNRAGLYTFFGDFGSGKTRALATICNELRDQMIETYYVPLAAVLDHLRSLIAQRADGSDYWDRLLNIPVLALDEITRFNATPWAQEKLFVLVDTRYRRRDSHLTVFATNDDPNTPMPVDQSLGYLLSRMKQGNVVKMQGDIRPALRGK